MRRTLLVIAVSMIISGAFAQADVAGSTGDSLVSETYTDSGYSDSLLYKEDTVAAVPVVFSEEAAAQYMISLLNLGDLWGPGGDTMKWSLSRLVDHYSEPFDTVESRLKRFNFDSIHLKQVELIKNDTLPLRWLNDSTVIIDTLLLEKEPYIIQKTIIMRAIDTSENAFKYELPDVKNFLNVTYNTTDSLIQKRDTLLHSADSTLSDSAIGGNEQFIRKMDSIIYGKDSLLIKHGLLIKEQDTIIKVVIDTLFLKSKGIQMHQVINNRIVPPFIPATGSKRVSFLPDSGKIILSEARSVIVSEGNSPFYIVPNEKMPDSLRAAVQTLLAYTEQRDSIQLFFNDIQGRKSPFWLTNNNDDLYRFWVKNYKNDSITIWVGNPSKKDVTLILEQDVNVNRLNKEPADDIPITTALPDRTFVKVEPLKEIPVYWDYSFSSSLAVNQTYLSNWSKGGENSVSNMLDIEGTAKHTNKEAKTVWTNNVRLKYGSTITEEYGLRTNTDMFNINSQFNKVIKEKIDFSAVFYMKNQVAYGYKYPDDSTLVSKFLNPTTFTIGAGLEYKPFKKTTLNFSILSYKNTFVLDTISVNQTRHGIDKGKKVRQEMGGQLVVKNSMSILDGLDISNTVRLFTNYLEKPQNVDVDWEINLERKINWYFTVLLNLHFIYDDDIRFPVLDDNDQPVLWPDGSPRVAPKLQFKEFLGLTLSFKF